MKTNPNKSTIVPNFMESEIEYFGFIPYCFTLDLQQSLEEALLEVVSDKSLIDEKISNIRDNLKKNSFVMANFINRNILQFPDNFNYERILSDKTAEGDLGIIIKDITKVQSKKFELLNKLQGLKAEFINKKNINEGYKNLLYAQKDQKVLLESVDNIQKSLSLLEDKYTIFTQKHKQTNFNFVKSIEHKSIEEDYYSKELEMLNQISKIESLDFILKSLNK